MNNQMSYTEIQEVFAKLKEQKISNTGGLMTYILHPYISGLGYQIYDFNQVIMDFDKGLLRANISEDIRLTVALRDSPNGYYELEKDKMFLLIDFNNSAFTLKFKVLNKWEVVETFKVDSYNKDNLEFNPEEDKLNALSKYIQLQNVIDQYAQKEERFFTESVVDRQLASGEYNNDFVLTSLANELKNPSQEFVNLLAQRLVTDYTTQDVSKVAEQLSAITDDGLVGMLDKIISTAMLPLNSTSAKPNLAGQKLPSNINTALKPTEEESNKLKGKFENAGFTSKKPIEKTTRVEDLVQDSPTMNKPQAKPLSPRPQGGLGNRPTSNLGKRPVITPDASNSNDEDGLDL